MDKVSNHMQIDGVDMAFWSWIPEHTRAHVHTQHDSVD